MKNRLFLHLMMLALGEFGACLDESLNSELQSLYRSHVLNHFFSQGDNSFLNLVDSKELEDDNTKKRNIAEAEDDSFHHENSIVSHNQTVRQIKPAYNAKTESNPNDFELVKKSAITVRPKANPYTYSVTATVVTPAPPYHASPTPIPYHGSSTSIPYHISHNPSIFPIPSYISTIPSSTPSPEEKSTTEESVTQSTASYPLPPIPTHPPSGPFPYKTSPYPFYPPRIYSINQTSNGDYADNPSPAPVHHSTSIPDLESTTPDQIFLSSPGPSHKQPVRQASTLTFAPQPAVSLQHHLLQKHLFTTNFTTKEPIFLTTQSTLLQESDDPTKENRIKVDPLHFNINKPAIQFQDQITAKQTDMKSNEQKSRNFVPFFSEQEQANISPNLDVFPKQEDRVPKQMQPDTTSEQHVLLQKSQLIQEKTTFNIPQQQPERFKEPKFLIEKQQQEEIFINKPLTADPSFAVPRQPQFSAQSNKFPQFEPQFPILQQQPIFSPKITKFPPKQNQAPQANIEEFSQNMVPQTTPNQQSLFQSINQMAPERPVHTKITDPSKMKHMAKKDALQLLIGIAGDDWDVELGIEQNLLDTSGKTDFICPSFEGHFPDPDQCSVYYQCSSGTPTKNTCQSGLQWNLLTNQCDWEANVDCSLNKSAGQLLHNV